MRRERGFADGCYEGVAGRHQAQATTQRGHGQLRLQDVLCGRLVSAEEGGQEEGGESEKVECRVMLSKSL